MTRVLESTDTVVWTLKFDGRGVTEEYAGNNCLETCRASREGPDLRLKERKGYGYGMSIMMVSTCADVE